MFVDPSPKLPDVGAYLERIGLAGQSLSPTLSTLNMVLEQHLLHIPFENLDAWAEHKAPDLTMAGLFRKIILRHRGGWCFELNALLDALLGELGFCVYPVGARVVRGKDYLPPVSHRGEVCVLDGRQYYCDVGYGSELFRTAIPMDGSVSAYGYFVQREGEKCFVCKDPASPQKLLLFADRPFEPVDYAYANYTNAVMPGLAFHDRLFASILTPEGHRRQLSGDTLQETCDGKLPETITVHNERELTELLREKLQIDYAFSRFPTFA